jgi:hypothetical protein
LKFIEQFFFQNEVFNLQEVFLELKIREFLESRHVRLQATKKNHLVFWKIPCFLFLKPLIRVFSMFLEDSLRAEKPGVMEKI